MTTTLAINLWIICTMAGVVLSFYAPGALEYLEENGVDLSDRHAFVQVLFGNFCFSLLFWPLLFCAFGVYCFRMLVRGLKE